MKCGVCFATVLLVAACSDAAPEKAAEKAGSSVIAAPEPPAHIAIPTAFHGRWGMVPADCTSTQGDAKGLLTITSEMMQFYESRGTPGSIAEQSPTRLVADFDFVGEGMTWQRRMVLDMQDDGRSLVRREYGADAAPGAFRYARCDA